jgi:hypothetical protein
LWKSLGTANIIDNYNLKTKVVRLSVDNTNTNFGGLLRKCKGNVLTKIKSQLNRNIIGFGCNAYIIHNCAKAAADSMPVDIEVFVTKIFGYFHMYTVRVERLKYFCDFAGEYKQIHIIQTYGGWWLSLLVLPTMVRILQIENFVF